MLKVVQVVSDTNIGGAGRYLLNYLKYYDRERFCVAVIVPENSMLTEFIRMHDEVKLIEAPYMADKSYDKNCVKFLKKVFKEMKPDILHTHASLSARIAGRASKVPCIIATRHCIEEQASRLKTAAMGLVNNCLCDYYIAVAGAVAKNLQEGGIAPNKIKTIFNGVEPARSYPLEAVKLERTRLGIKDYEFVFGIFARLEKVKGHRYFLRAAREIRRSGYHARFLIVGDGSLRSELEEKVKEYDLSENVIFTGYVKDTALLLNVADVNVISSDSEAMSLSILEAMSLGKPTIATRTGGNPEVVKNEKNGLLVGAADSASLAEAMIKMMENEPMYQALSQNARQMYEENFKADIMVRNLEKFYEEVTQNVH